MAILQQNDFEHHPANFVQLHGTLLPASHGDAYVSVVYDSMPEHDQQSIAMPEIMDNIQSVLPKPYISGIFRVIRPLDEVCLGTLYGVTLRLWSANYITRKVVVSDDDSVPVYRKLNITGKARVKAGVFAGASVGHILRPEELYDLKYSI